MSFMVDLPEFYCLMRGEYAYNMDSKRVGTYIPVFVFGADTVEGRAVGFYCYSNVGAMFSRLPISAFVFNHSDDNGKPSHSNFPLDYLELWDCFSYEFEAKVWGALKGMRCDVILKDGKWYPGQYMFTFGWWGNRLAEDAGEGGFKLGHVIQLDHPFNQYAIQPNNRIRWYEPSFVTKPFPESPDFKTNDQNWKCESRSKWRTSDDDRYFYKIITDEEI